MSAKNIKNTLALLGDIVVFYLALTITLLIRHSGDFSFAIVQLHLEPFSYVLAIWLITFYAAGLYDIRTAGRDINFLNLLVRSVLIAAALAVVFFYFTAKLFFEIRPLTVLAIDILVFTALLVLWRLALSSVFSTTGLSYGVIFLGGETLANEVSQELKNKRQLGFQVKKLLSQDDLGQTTDLKTICETEKINIMVISPEIMQNPQIVSKVYQCLPLQIRIVDLPSFYEEVMGKIPINAIGQAWFLEKISLHRRRIYNLAKRCGDTLLALFLGVFSLMLTPIIVMAIKLDSQGSALYRQKRTGQNGRVINIIKFRTMVTDAEAHGQAIWSQDGDARITRVGSFLRKTRLDELPQLINIIRGDLSFVGPRPERPEFVAQLTQKIPFYGERHLVKPGLTGWAQISLPYDASEEYSREKLQYDLYYIKNRSLLLDLGIILRTSKSIINRAGR